MPFPYTFLDKTLQPGTHWFIFDDWIRKINIIVRLNSRNITLKMGVKNG
ncbi:hypothetical protein LCGC14_1476680 [marine sediment metagenome]|uniref:Uncharacterized protein n=1 Tax=marine sediment metagenome TaxID=412755 RepID=A0A0F9MCG9_9ZZZZ